MEYDDDIQLAESFLLSAMYQDAAQKSSDVLKALRSASSSSSLETEDAHRLKQMIESAGMVLLQATNEMGRLGSVLRVLEDHFGTIHYVPYYLLIPGVALQVKGGVFYPARQALEAFLMGWSMSEDTFGVHTKVYEGSTMYLPSDVYGDLVEVYAVHVLARGSSDQRSALGWVQRANMVESRKQKIIKKIGPVMSNSGPVRNNSPENVVTENIWKIEENTSTKRESSTTRLGFSQFLKAFQTGALGRWTGHWKTITTGTLAFIIAYAVLRQRRLLMSRARSGLTRVRTMFLEFWELAFGLQINPLAAVQALPTARQ